MKLHNIAEVEAFQKALDQCQHDVFLTDAEGNKLNLKSKMSQYVAIGELLSQRGEYMELFATTREDEAILLGFFANRDR